MSAELTYDLVYGDRSLATAPQNRAATWSRDEGESLASDLRDCQFSPKRGPSTPLRMYFDKHVLSAVEGLSLSGWDSIPKRFFPLTLSLSKGVSAFSDSLLKERERSAAAAAAEQYDARS